MIEIVLRSTAAQVMPVEAPSRYGGIASVSNSSKHSTYSSHAGRSFRVLATSIPGG
jgi:hypothetical protein